MLNQIAYYEKNWQFFKHQVSAAPTDEATGKEFLKAVRAYAKKLKFPSSLYSPVSAEYGIPTFAKPEELVTLHHGGRSRFYRCGYPWQACSSSTRRKRHTALSRCRSCPCLTRSRF